MGKRKFGDRKDGVWLRNVDGLHTIMPYIYPNRADNEAFIQESFDMAPINEYVNKKNDELRRKVESGELPKEALDDLYKPFQVVLCALMKTIHLRPKLNRFIQGKKLFQRNVVSLGFVVKKKFADNGGEGLAFKVFDEDTTMDVLHKKIVDEINFCRDENTKDNSTGVLDKFAKLPPFILRFAFLIVRFLDQKGWLPYSLIKTDPDYASCFITNLGSIGLKSGYHHLSNWGTTSFFVIIGEKKWKPIYDKDGNMEMKEIMDIGLTIDERIADGYYFSKSVKLLKKLLSNPELLDLKASEKVEID